MHDCRAKGETPLHRAAAFGDEEAIQMLLKAGAKLEARDMHGDTPLSWAS
jgi:ankyrin repeat protein